MATCPYCLGALTDDHQCPKRRSIRHWQLLGCIVGGAALGFVVMALVDPAQHLTDFDIWVVALGAVIGAVAYRLLVSA